MGIVHVRRGRLAPALILTLLVALAIVAALALTAGPASAHSSSYSHGGASCATCHPGGYTTPPVVPPANSICQGCHTGGFIPHDQNGAASTCYSCHAPGQDMSAQVASCGTSSATGGCHNNAGHIGSTVAACTTCHTQVTAFNDPGQSAHHKTSVTDVQVKALLTIKAPASVKVKKTIKATGFAKSDQAGYVVTVLVQQKVGTKWVKKASKAAVWVQGTSSWTFSYKPTKKGTWRMQASTPAVAGTNGNATAITAGKTAYKTFKVK